MAHFACAENIYASELCCRLVFTFACPQCSVVLDVFLGAQSIVGLINIVPQFVVVLATIVSFARVDGLAAICLLPLAAWVAFAGVLNSAIWLLNS
jgi:tryptophan-rich sensory protein